MATRRRSLVWPGFHRVELASRYRGCASFLLCLFTGVSVTGGLACWSVGMLLGAFKRVSEADSTFTLNKFECSKQAFVPENSCME